MVVSHLPFARYRVLSRLRRLGTYPFLMRFPADLGGGVFHCDLRDATAAEVCFTGRYEPQETQLLRDLLEPGNVFVDVGANWGYYTLAAAHMVGPEGRVVAFEPEPRLFALLTANIAANTLRHVLLQPAANRTSTERDRSTASGLTMATGGSRDPSTMTGRQRRTSRATVCHWTTRSTRRR